MSRMNKFPDDKYRFVTLTGVGVNCKFSPLSEKHAYDKKFFQSFVKHFRRLGLIEEYFAVKTDEGLGVIHLVYTGKSIRYHDLRAVWLSLSGSWNVSIRLVKDKPAIMRELVYQRYQYRYWFSRGWKC